MTQSPTIPHTMLLFSGAALFLAGCAPVAFMGAATSVTTSFAEERGMGGVVSDADIKARIHLKWIGYNADISNAIDLTVRQGAVLMTGNIPTPQMKVDAVRLAWEVVGVREVIDQTKINGESGFTGYAKDGWIGTTIRSKIFFDNDIRSLNYTIQCHGQIVYIMGIAQNQQELDRVIHYARNTSGVEEVVSYVKIKPASSTGGQAISQQPLSDIQRPTPPGRDPRDGGTNRQNPTPDQGDEITVIDVETLDGPNTGSAFN